MLEMHHQSSLGFVIGFEAIKKDFLESFTLFENNAELQNVSFYMFTISIMKWQENAQVMTQVNKVGKVMF